MNREGLASIADGMISRYVHFSILIPPDNIETKKIMNVEETIT